MFWRKKKTNITGLHDLIITTIEGLYPGLWVIRVLPAEDSIVANGPNGEYAKFSRIELLDYTQSPKRFVKFITSKLGRP